MMMGFSFYLGRFLYGDECWICLCLLVYNLFNLFVLCLCGEDVSVAFILVVVGSEVMLKVFFFGVYDVWFIWVVILIKLIFDGLCWCGDCVMFMWFCVVMMCMTTFSLCLFVVRTILTSSFAREFFVLNELVFVLFIVGKFL